MTHDNASRINDLESRLAFQEDYLSAMNKRIVEQDNEIAKLQLQLQHLNQKLKDGLDSDPDGFSYTNERPPHY